MGSCYRDSVYLSIYDEEGFLAGVLRRQVDPYSEYTGHVYRQSIRWIKNIIFNMNKTLLCKKDSVPKEIFALRLVEETGIDGAGLKLVPTRTYKTNQLLEKFKDDYYISTYQNRHFEVTLDSREADEERRRCDLSICLNISTNVVILSNYFDILTSIQYCDILSYPVGGIVKHRSSRPDFPNEADDPNEDYHMLNCISFNMLDEIYEIAEKNKEGFRGKLINSFVVLK